ncbi:MAG: hypothetical protein JXQ72_02885 [Anaerolineae bacterium]|nr:hypothetical protein [Anaerolineae bacterium]
MLKLSIENPAPIPSAHPSLTEEWRDNDGIVCATGFCTGEEYWFHLRGLAGFRFDVVSDEVTAIPVENARRDWIIDSFYRSALPLVLQVRGSEVLHASAVIMPAGVVAFGAISETGKSTLAYAFSQRGYEQWADDAVLFSIDGGSAHTTQLPFAIRLRPESASFFGRSTEIDLVRTGTAPAAVEMPLAAVCALARLPEDQESPPVEIRRIRAAEALTTLLTHAYCFSLRDVERKKLMMQNYMALAVNVPVLEVRFRRGLDHLPAILDAIEQVVSTDRTPETQGVR